ncbi:MAG TPA: stage 0 sporulation family protein, partial [Clostridiales bacterium]|nr:stage 0 sporulation family protein [Clostridiales bacterium]
MQTIVGIQFRNTGKVYYFAPGKLVFAKGDGAIVETARGLEYAEVVLPNCEVDDSEIKGELKPVVRKATPKDTANYRVNLERRPKAIRDAQAMANKRKLDMKVVDAEFSFDGSKATFYFTADQRVDFRDLVKEMAATFRCRIELRQIGIRDECRMKGGLGPCGRVCCCNCCNTDFDRVSIKMAKHQGLSLNPTKISGLCGRLMCCL